ncbi:trypsin, partial [Nephila pilipes]
VPLFRNSSLNCGGAVISKKFILTVAHCFFNQKSFRKFKKCKKLNTTNECYNRTNDFSIRLLGKEKFGKKLKLKRIIIHPKFDFLDVVYDIALLELAEPLNCSKMINPICLPTNKEMYKIDQKFFIAGWGKYEITGLEGPQMLREGIMKEVPVEKCMRVFLPNKIKYQYQCAVGTSETSCTGDSGTPNFIKIENNFYILGIVSHGLNFLCKPKYPVVFTKVLYFLKWIKEYVNDLPEPFMT